MATLKILAGLVLSIGILGSAHATAITFAAESIAGSDWRYRYTATNDSLGVSINEFTIYFDRNLYSNLAVETSPVDWDPLVVQPDLGIPSDGFFDALALASGIAPGDSLSGFAVSFTYLGQGTPGAQAFDILDANFDVIDSGSTATATNGTVPEPAILLLMVTAFAALLARRNPARSAIGVNAQLAAA